MISDETMAAWVKEQNRGAPAWEDLDHSARAWWRDRYTIRHAGVKQDTQRRHAGENIVRRIVDAWDCCGTCAGGVLATYTRERMAQAYDEGWNAYFEWDRDATLPDDVANPYGRDAR